MINLASDPKTWEVTPLTAILRDVVPPSLQPWARKCTSFTGADWRRLPELGFRLVSALNVMKKGRIEAFRE